MYVTFIKHCKRMVNTEFECGKPYLMCFTIIMVEKHIEMLEGVARGEDWSSLMLRTQIIGNLENLPRVWRKGGTIVSSQNATSKKKKTAGHLSVGYVEQRYINIIFFHFRE